MWVAQLVVNFTAGYTLSHGLNQLILKSYPTSVSNLLVATGRKNMEGENLASCLLAPTPVDKFTHSSFAKTGNSFSGLSRQTGIRNSHVVPRNSRPQKQQKKVGISETQPHVLSITGFLSLQCETAIVGLSRPWLLS